MRFRHLALAARRKHSGSLRARQNAALAGAVPAHAFLIAMRVCATLAAAKANMALWLPCCLAGAADGACVAPRPAKSQAICCLCFCYHFLGLLQNATIINGGDFTLHVSPKNLLLNVAICCQPCVSSQGAALAAPARPRSNRGLWVLCSLCLHVLARGLPHRPTAWPKRELCCFVHTWAADRPRPCRMSTSRTKCCTAR